MGRNKTSLQRVQIAIRIAPEADTDFAKRFMKDMKSQLEIGPYYLSTVTSFQDIKADYIERNGISDQLKSIYAITAFLVINIFLGLIGTFWYRAQARRSEIGLRIAMGATRRNVRRMMSLETLFLLFIASVIAVNICINIGQNEVVGAFDIPVGDRTLTGSGIEQDFLNYALTFLFLGAVSLLAVWYPTHQASVVPPAEALRDE
jgi:putative ABC transport system permease protein